MSTIEAISAALSYDACEMLLIKGSLSDALAMAALQAADMPVGDDASPESVPTISATLRA